MKIDLNIAMLNENGESFKDNETLLTLGVIIKRALLTPQRDDSAAVKVDKFETFVKVSNSELEVDLSTDDIVLIKKCIGESFGQIIVGQTYRLLEGKENGIKTEKT